MFDNPVTLVRVVALSFSAVTLVGFLAGWWAIRHAQRDQQQADEFHKRVIGLLTEIRDQLRKP